MFFHIKTNCLKYCNHLSELCDIDIGLLDIAEKKIIFSNEALEHFCIKCSFPSCNVFNTHLYGINEAFRWNGKYIYYCPLGLIFVASSVTDDRCELSGGMVAGPIVMGSLSDTLEELNYKPAKDNVTRLPVFETSKINHLAEIVSLTAAYAGGMPHNKAQTFLYEQDKILNTIYKVKDLYTESNDHKAYPINYEKQIHDLICKGDKQGSQLLLNELLGHIFLTNDFNLDAIKARILELIVVLSRATIDAGADINEIFCFNINYIKDIERITNIDDIGAWITAIMHRFINYAFDFTQVKHSDVVFKAMNYIKLHYSEKISLDDLARVVFLSKSYLSSIFKEEVGESISAYINKIRVEKSKLMLQDSSANLADIANLCGFEDQSYFTKVFKRIAGVSPKTYRDKRGQM